MGNAEQKVVFQSTLRQLLSRPVEVNATEFWDRIWNPYLTKDDINSLLAIDDLRDIRKNRPDNIYSMMRNIVRRLVIGKGNDVHSLQNTLSLLCRVLPIVFEDPQLANDVFWTEKPPEKEGEEKIILGKMLVDALLLLLFEKDLTTYVDPLQHIPNDWDLYVSNGILHTPNMLPQYRLHVSNRCEVLLCIILCCSSVLYYPPSKSPEEDHLHIEEREGFFWYKPRPNKFVECIVGNDSKITKALFVSLLVGSFTYDPVGWGIPYNHVWGADPREMLMERSLQLLVILLEYRSLPLPTTSTCSENSPREHDSSWSVPPNKTTKSISSPTFAPVPLNNIFVKYLEQISFPKDFELMWSGLISILNNPINACNTYLPYSTKQVGCHQEMAMVFYLTLLINKNFLAYGIEKDLLLKVSYPILYYVYEGRKDQAQLGIVHLGIFILYFLSGIRDFSVMLNTKFTYKAPADLNNTNDCFADLFFTVMIKLITDGHPKLSTLRECCLTILANYSPYIKTLSKSTSVAFMKLFVMLTKPAFLFANEKNYKYCIFLIEAINNILQYQYVKNTPFICELLKNRIAFSQLMRLRIKDPEDGSLSLLSQENEMSRKSEFSISTPQPEKSLELEKKSPSLEKKSLEKSPELEKKLEGELEINPEEKKEIPESINDIDNDEKKSENEESNKPIEIEDQKEKISPQPSSEGIMVNKSTPPEPRFYPTNEWLESWQKKLPILTIHKFLSALVPKINNFNNEAYLSRFIENTTVVGLLPIPHPISTRFYWPTVTTLNWFHSYMWGVIFLRNLPCTILINTKIALFVVNVET